MFILAVFWDIEVAPGIAGGVDCFYKIFPLHTPQHIVTLYFCGDISLRVGKKDKYLGFGAGIGSIEILKRSRIIDLFSLGAFTVPSPSSRVILEKEFYVGWEINSVTYDFYMFPVIIGKRNGEGWYELKFYGIVGREGIVLEKEEKESLLEIDLYRYLLGLSFSYTRRFRVGKIPLKGGFEVGMAWQCGASYPREYVYETRYIYLYLNRIFIGFGGGRW